MNRRKYQQLLIVPALLGALLLPRVNAVLAQPLPTTAAQLPTRTPEEVEAERHMLEAELDDALRDPARSKWALLPSTVSDVFFDQRGKAWFRMGLLPINARVQIQGPVSNRGVEDAVTGKTRAIQGSVLLIDAFGRVWRPNRDTIERYDGRQWKSWQLGTAAKQSRLSHPSSPRLNPANDEQYQLEAIEAGFEDSTGTCWFAADSFNSTGLSLLRILPDGTKKQDWIEDPMASELDVVRYAQCGFFEQPGGKMLFVLPMSLPRYSENRQTTLSAFRFDGQSWKRVQPKFCDHRFNYVIPQENGSIKFVCEAGRIWTYWPDDMIETARKQVRDWFNALDDSDPQKRDAAYRGLLTIGPQLNELLPKADDESLSPASQISMRKIRENYEQMSKVDEQGLHSSLTFYDAGLEVGAAMPIARTRGGGAVLSAMPIRQAGQQDPMSQGLLWIDSTGKYAVKPAAPQYFIKPYAGGGSPGDGWGDMAGGLWHSMVGGPAMQARFSTLRRPNGEYVHATPPGSLVEQIIGEDADGRLYFRLVGGNVVAFDDKFPSTVRWRSINLKDNGALRALNAGGAGWSLSNENNTAKLLKLGPDGAKPVTLATPSSILRTAPLLENSLLIETADRQEANTAHYYDGAKWISGASIPAIFRDNAAEIMKVVPSVAVGTGSPNRFAAVRNAEGAPQGLWLYDDPFDPLSLRPASAPARGAATRSAAARGATTAPRAPATRPAVPVVRGTLSYFDGVAWHDATAQIRRIVPNISVRPFEFADRGRAALLSMPRGKFVWVRYTGDGNFEIKQIDVATLPGLTTNSAAVPDDLGGIWVGTAPTPSVPRTAPLHYLHETAPIAFPDRRYYPKMRDSAGRVWFSDEGRRMLIVKDGEKWYEQMVKGVASNTPLLEGPDGRLWLVLPDALVLVALVDDGGAKKVATERFAWDGPKSPSRNPAYIDSGNGIWMHGYGGLLSRYVLPAAKVPAIKPLR